MPTATLKFRLPEEAEEFSVAKDGAAWQSTAQAVDEACRTWLKHGHAFATADEAIQALRKVLHDECESCGIALW